MELARQFGVHRGTVREALRELETNGVLKRERGSKLMMVTRPARGTWRPACQPRARAARRELSRRVGGAHRARAAHRRRGGAPAAQARGPGTHRCASWRPSTCGVEQTADFFRAVGEATHNGVFMLAHEPLVQMLVPSLAALIDKVPQAGSRIAAAQKRISAAIRGARHRVSAAEWMAKHIRDFRRGFEIARIALEQPVANG